MKKAFLLSIFALPLASSHGATSSYRNAVLANNPVAYYELDETSGTTAVNSGSMGAALNATINTDGGTVTVGQGSFAQGGTAYDFGGGYAGAAALTNSLNS